jgi:cytochrome o ubiquinol oxidase subunit 2
MSANFSGDGFSDMQFIAEAVPTADFDSWVAAVRSGGSALDDAGYAELAKPSQAVPPTTYRSVDPKLFDRIIEQTVTSPPLPNPPPHAGEGRVGAGADAAWRPPAPQAGG